MIAATQITLPDLPSLTALIICAAVALLVYVLWPRNPKETTKRYALIGGAALLVSAVLFGGVGGSSPPGPNPAPPNPYPGPAPGPQPASNFQERVKQSFNGTQQEALILSAMFSMAGDAVEWDGQRATPLLKNTGDFGGRFNEMQRYRGLSETPWGDKFPQFKNVVGTEMQARNIYKPEVVEEFTPITRVGAAQLYREVGAALASFE